MATKKSSKESNEEGSQEDHQKEVRTRKNKGKQRGERENAPLSVLFAVWSRPADFRYAQPQVP